MKLQGKVAIVTGAGSGMGKAIATLYAQEGAKVIVADINQASIDAVVAEIKEAGGEAAGEVVNVGNKEDVERMINAATSTYGSLDILVNNAGVMDNFTPVGDVSDELWDRLIDINLKGPFMACRAAVNIMKEQPNGGVIVNNASVGGLFGTRGGAAYIASKHGLIGLTKNIASTYGREGGNIRANAIAPGGVKTNIQSTITAPHPLGLAALTDAGSGKLADPLEIARVALFLASDDSSFVNGDVIKADGGWTAR
ncbi:NAD(P)-dependent dehydrogenase (short-subunit alcohol dehydrogenase family) [Paenibacillus cellulosilyticus]|uniref:NAD(P)-dependent dehydrogenase (Short-subunit alcohol dehydrogenase family) n=1 Tax=Paenibacillus cellulosilyticus TaxID=375489 RepID=A0A2V2YXN2_9BACL|nr:glucose 1-dehydrogenase [Paenibacillus cellulosilyticus]PWW06507.1 NAD(P)-dependent dehydrogenase (short-subunit alcohol dehydrogenase family) [Paenibacillus cellulosilyticus]QKS46154.1 glucose 1-dehydrogenase [Paenibacillus cellulosilyticus]